MKTTPISTIMTKQVRHIDVEADVIEARNLMDKYEINHLPVLEDGKLAGILSKNDLNQVEFLCDFVGERLEQSTIFKSLSIQELMTENVKSLKVDSTISEAVQIFSNNSFQSLPIMDNGELVGIVTTKDVFGYMLVE